MFKETVICIVIVVLIFSLDMFTQRYTDKTTAEITEIFSELKELAVKEEKDKMETKMAGLDEKWNKKHDKLAYYIEHDELEKVKTELTGLRGYIEKEEYSEAVPELDKSVYILEHIKDKTALNLKNIF